jgi:hypothetical protein
MSNPLRTAADYELLLYTLPQQFPSIQRSTITFVRRGVSLARVAGALFFAQDFKLVVRERVLFQRLPALLDWYGYEIWQGDEKLCWYDPQPHPDTPSLQSTHPHHKHIPPDIKHNRLPAPNMRFDESNLPYLIAEIESLIAAIA